MSFSKSDSFFDIAGLTRCHYASLSQVLSCRAVSRHTCPSLTAGVPNHNPPSCSAVTTPTISARPTRTRTSNSRGSATTAMCAAHRPPHPTRRFRSPADVPPISRRSPADLPPISRRSPSQMALFGVFDGHGENGAHVSQFVRDTLPEQLKISMAQTPHDVSTACRKVRTPAASAT